MKIILLIFLLFNILFAKRDFYYSFINDNKKQMAQYKKDLIIQDNNKLLLIKRLVREGQLEEAYKKIISLREKHNKILQSAVELLYAEILYKRGSRKFAVEGEIQLRRAINKSIISESDLLSALRLLVKLELKVDKVKDARFYAKLIINSFDDPMAIAYGKIALAQIDIYKRRYRQAIRVLYKILVETNNIEVATVVADELYDVYVLNGDDKKAYTLATKVLQKNIAYYANDSYLALKKVDKLVRADMPQLAIKILKKLLANAKQVQSINTFKFKLANTYMAVRTHDPKYMLKAKELYKDLLNSKNDNRYKQRAKMYIDEILMREGKLPPSLVAKKYSHSDSMQEKALMQELLTQAKEHKYDEINKLKKIYSQISTVTARRFGYKSIKNVFAIINSDMIKYYLEDDKCFKLSKVFHSIDISSLKKIIQDNITNEKMFNCLYEYPNKLTFQLANKAFKDSKNSELYLYLEKMALELNLPDDAYNLSLKIDMLKDDKIKSKEFLYRFLIYGKLNNRYSMEKFFLYANKHPKYIEQNQNNPLIIDFYYQYYLYLIGEKKEDKALKILKKLNQKQKEMDAYVYSPFVQIELANEAKLDDNYEQDIKYLKDALENSRKITKKDLVKIYYEMANAYKELGKENRYKDMVNKCKNVKNVKSLYKKMCERL